MYYKNRKAKNKAQYNDSITIDELRNVYRTGRKSDKQLLREMILTRLKEAAERGKNRAEVEHLCRDYDIDAYLFQDVLDELERDGYTVNLDLDSRSEPYIISF